MNEPVFSLMIIWQVNEETDQIMPLKDTWYRCDVCHLVVVASYRSTFVAEHRDNVYIYDGSFEWMTVETFLSIDSHKNGSQEGKPVLLQV